MPKRFIDSVIWDDAEFVAATPKRKLLALFMISKCDPVGVFNMAPAIISAYLGEKFTKEDALACPVDVVEISPGKFWMRKFCTHQYGKFDPACRPHQSYIKLLEMHGILNLEPMATDRVSLPYQRGIDTPKDKDKEKDKEIEKEKDSSRPAARPGKKPRPRDEVFDFIALEFGIEPEVQGSRIGKLANQFKKYLPGVQGWKEEIKRRRENYRAKWPQAADTPEALVKHWGSMDVKQEDGHGMLTRIVAESRAARAAIRNAASGQGGVVQISGGGGTCGEMDGAADFGQVDFECPGME